MLNREKKHVPYISGPKLSSFKSVTIDNADIQQTLGIQDTE
jgi:hypothetical protein